MPRNGCATATGVPYLICHWEMLLAAVALLIGTGMWIDYSAAQHPVFPALPKQSRPTATAPTSAGGGATINDNLRAAILVARAASNSQSGRRRGFFERRAERHVRKLFAEHMRGALIYIQQNPPPADQFTSAVTLMAENRDLLDGIPELQELHDLLGVTNPIERERRVRRFLHAFAATHTA